MSAVPYPLAPDPSQEWTGAKRRYDLIKEAVVAITAVFLLVILLAFLFSSPDEKPVTIAQWATKAPHDFLTTAMAELDGTSGVASYGPPYTNVPGAGQNIIGGISIARLIGVQIPINPPKAFILEPLSIPAASDVPLAAALTTYRAASPAQQQSWDQAFAKALDKGNYTQLLQDESPQYGPVPVMMSGLLTMARSGGLDGALLSTNRFYQSNFTKSLLFLNDGSYMEDLASQQNLLGDQWGMMNETGNYPGQAWLWLYTFWYQISPFKTSDNADAQVWAIMMVLSLGLITIPFLPVVRSVPRYVPLYRLIWRDYYKVAQAKAAQT